MNAKVYVIYNNETNNIYVGSSTNRYLNTRLAQHRYYYRKAKEGNRVLHYSSEKCFEDDEGNEVDCFITSLAEDLTLDERYLVESHYIHLLKESGFNVVNINDSMIHKEIEKKKRYDKYHANPEKYRQASRNYYLKNREKVLAKSANYYYKNKALKDQYNIK
tara:strand:+ start:704 stop:1189 length:486 start_codon:yes stop_codon:yes gene_type:complete